MIFQNQNYANKSTFILQTLLTKQNRKDPVKNCFNKNQCKHKSIKDRCSLFLSIKVIVIFFCTAEINSPHIKIIYQCICAAALFKLEKPSTVKQHTCRVCKFFLNMTPHPEVCLCFAFLRPATHHRWPEYPGRFQHDRWPP